MRRIGVFPSAQLKILHNFAEKYLVTEQMTLDMFFDKEGLMISYLWIYQHLHTFGIHQLLHISFGSKIVNRHFGSKKLKVEMNTLPLYEARKLNFKFIRFLSCQTLNFKVIRFRSCQSMLSEGKFW